MIKLLGLGGPGNGAQRTAYLLERLKMDRELRLDREDQRKLVDQPCLRVPVRGDHIGATGMLYWFRVLSSALTRQVCHQHDPLNILTD